MAAPIGRRYSPKTSARRWADPGNELLWRSTHVYAGGEVNSTVRSLQIKWRTKGFCFLKDYSVSVQDRRVEIQWEVAELEDNTEFFVLRRVGSAAEYTEVESPDIAADRLAFTFVDPEIAFEGAHEYRIDVQDDFGRRVPRAGRPTALPATTHQNLLQTPRPTLALPLPMR